MRWVLMQVGRGAVRLRRNLGVVLTIMWLGLWFGCQPLPKTAESPVGRDHLASGQALFAEHCAACHGPRGQGDGYAGLTPPPADLTSPKASTQLAPQLIRTVHEGRPNTAMGAWNQLLSNQQIEDVVAYLRTLRE